MPWKTGISADELEQYESETERSDYYAHARRRRGGYLPKFGLMNFSPA